MARQKKTEPDGEVRGRALVDLPQFGAKAGDYLTLPAAEAGALEAAGAFDPQAREA